MLKRVVWVVFSFLLFLSVNASGMTPAEGKLLFQTLGEIKGELKQLNRRIDGLDKRIDGLDKRIDGLDKRIDGLDKRIDMVNKRIDDLRKEMNARFEQVDKRFEQIDKRFEQVDKRFEEFFTYIKIMLMGVFGLIGTFVGLLIWDRKTAMNETKRKIYREMNSEVAPEKFVKVIKGLRKLAEKDEVLREYLKKEGLL